MGQHKTIEGYRLSPQQQRLCLLQQRSSNLTAQCAVHISGELRLPALLKSLDLLVSRHEALRTAYQIMPGLDVPLQVIDGDAAAPALRRLDYSALDESQRTDALSLLLKQERAADFDLARGRTLHPVLVSLGRERHLLVLTLPALCADSRSLVNVVQELARLYQAGGDDSRLPAEVVQFVQFSEWQHELLESEDEAAGREFWQHERTLPAAAPRLPSENARADETAYEPESAVVTVEPEVAEALAALTGVEPGAAAAALLACWQSLLWRLTAEPDINVEVAFSGRKYDEMAGALGLYGRWLPVRCAVDEATTFREVLGKVTRATSAAEAKQEFYAPRRVEAGAEGDEVATPLAVGFEHEEWPEDLRAADSTWRLSSLYACSELFKLRLRAVTQGGTLRLTFHYDSRSFDAPAIERLSAQYLTLLRAAVTAPDRPLSSLELLGEAERRQLLVEWRGAATDFPRGHCLHQLVEAQAARTPQRTAAVYEDEEITYAQLNERANRLAHHLRALGVGPEVRVGILMERSVEMFVALLGVLKAGGAYVPFDPACPRERLSFMADDADVAVMLTRRRLAEELQTLRTRVIALDTESEDISERSAENPSNLSRPDDLAYVIYTSGSAGRPKGVMIQHRSVLNLLAALERSVYAGHGELQRVSVNAPLSFDASVKQVIQLAQGRTLCLAPEWARRDGEALRDYVVRRRVEVLDCTPAQLRLLAQASASTDAAASGAGAAEPARASGLSLFGGSGGLPRVVLVGGEAIDPRLWRRLAADPATAYYNLYGPTECTVDATCCRVSPERATPSIGAPLPNMQVLILDGRLQLAPVGVAGEICIGGEGVGRGYLGDEELTKQKYVAHPFADEQGARLYRTGDVGRYAADGSLEYVGRADRQVKLRGYRIEPDEIEAVIAQHGSVRECAVLAREDEEGDRRLVAYVVPHRPAPGAAEAPARYRLPNGTEVAHRNHNETAYLYDEIFAKRSYLRHGVTLPEGACVFDVGANIGMFTLFVREQCPTARVYAFEPLRELCQTLRHNGATPGGEVKVFEHGLSDRERDEEFTFYERYTMMSGASAYADAASEVELIKSYLGREQERGASGAAELLKSSEELLAGRFEGRAERCRLRRLADVIREEGVGQIDLLKVDVQRAELDVLRGLGEEDWAKIKQLVMEVHDKTGDASEGRGEEIRLTLERRGFRVVVEQDESLRGTDRHNLYAVREGWDGKAAGGTARGPAWQAAREDVVGLREFVRARLPEYMLPSAYVELGRLPLTRHGKVDWRALPAPGFSDAHPGAVFAEPENDVERDVADIWRKVLRVERVSCDANFFDIGGHSLLILQVCNHLREHFGRNVTVIELFKHPTVRSLAKHLGTGDGEAAPFAEVAGRMDKRESALRRRRQLMEERRSK